MDRMDLTKKALWSNSIPTDAKEFYFIPRVFLLRDFPQNFNNNARLTDVRDVVDLDISATPIYVAVGQKVTMQIINGKLDITVSTQE